MRAMQIAAVLLGLVTLAGCQYPPTEIIAGPIVDGAPRSTYYRHSVCPSEYQDLKGAIDEAAQFGDEVAQDKLQEARQVVQEACNPRNKTQRHKADRAVETMRALKQDDPQ